MAIPIDTILKTLLGQSPVLMLLAVLVYLDSWKLVDLSRVLQMLVIGGLLATGARVINGAAMSLTHLELPTYGRYLAPCIEESLKRRLTASELTVKVEDDSKTGEKVPKK